MKKKDEAGYRETGIFVMAMRYKKKNNWRIKGRMKERAMKILS